MTDDELTIVRAEIRGALLKERKRIAGVIRQVVQHRAERYFMLPPLSDSDLQLLANALESPDE